MNYELCKKLKDAGFVFRAVHLEREFKGDQLYLEKEHYIIPTLSELIEACGEDFGSLERFREFRFAGFSEDKKQWFAEKRYIEIVFDKCNNKKLCNSPRVIESGSTPEETVANLWLASNKK